LVLHDGVE
jgi:hypothetical protein